MLASHSRQPLAIWVIRVCELDIYGSESEVNVNDLTVNVNGVPEPDV